jgi:hypothetical protein
MACRIESREAVSIQSLRYPAVLELLYLPNAVVGIADDERS